MTCEKNIIMPNDSFILHMLIMCIFFINKWMNRRERVYGWRLGGNKINFRIAETI